MAGSNVAKKFTFCLLVSAILFPVFNDVVVGFSSNEYLIEVYGSVVDFFTISPIFNATIIAFYYSHGGYHSVTVSTDSSGSYNLSLSIPITRLHFVKKYGVYIGVFYDDPLSPGFDYIPQLLPLNLTFNEGRFSARYDFNLHPAASIRVFDSFLHVNFSKPADKMTFLVFFSNGSSFNFEYSVNAYGELDESATKFLLNRMGVASNEIIVPINCSFNVIVRGSFIEYFYVPVVYSWWTREISVSSYAMVSLPLIDDNVTLSWGSVYETSVLKATLRDSQEIVNELFSSVSDLVDRARADGFYVVSLNNRLDDINRLIDDAERLYRGGDFLACYSALREAYIALDNMISYIKWMRSEVNSSGLSLIVFFSISSLALALIVTEKNYLRPLISPIFSFSFLYLLLTSLPKFYFHYSYYIITLLPSLMLAFSLFISKFLPVSSMFPRVVNLVDLLSVAKRNLRRRKIRTLALLMSLIFFTFGSVALTSFSYEIGVLTRENANEFGVMGISFERMFPSHCIVEGFTDVEAENNPYALPPSQRILSVINSTGKTMMVTVRAESKAKVRSYGWLTPLNNPLKKLDVYGIVAFSSELDPVYMKLHEFLITGSMPINENDIVISVKAANLLGVSLGDRVIFKDKLYQVVGLLDDRKLFYAKEISGRPLLPYKMFLSLKGEDGLPSLYESEVCPPESVIFLVWSEARRLNLSSTRFFVYMNVSSSDLMSAGKAAALCGGGHVITILVGEKSLNLALLEYAKFSGFEALIPVLLIIFNAAITAQAALHERRRETMILSAVGCSPPKLFAIFLFEAFLIGFSGGAIGYALGLSSYKLMYLISPLDVKPKISFIWVLISMSTAIISMIVGVALTLRSSLLIVPSRLWRIKAIKSAEMREDLWLFEIPIRIESSMAEDFMNFIYEELKSFPSSSEEKLNVVSFKREVDDDRKVIVIIFTYDTGVGGVSKNTSRGFIELTTTNGKCEVYLKVKSYGADPERYAYKTARLIRNMALKWR